MSDKTYYVQTSLAGGEVSSDINGRTDLSKFSVAAKTMLNFYPHFFGGASNRPGTKFVVEVKDSNNPVKLLPFRFSASQAYVIEAGGGSFRYINDGGQIINTTSNADAWATSTAYTVDKAVKNDGLIYRCILAHTSSATNEPGTGASWATYWLQSNIVETTTTYAANDLFNLKTAQSADVLYMCNSSYKPKTLTRSSHYDWDLEDFDFKNGPFRTQNATDTTITASAITGTGITLTASASIFESGHIGSIWQISHDVTEQELNETFTSTTTSSSILCNGSWSLITHGSWAGTIKLQRSTDGGDTWDTIRSYHGNGDFNPEVSGDTDEAVQLRLNYTYTSGACYADLNAYSFINDGIVKITAVASGTSATADVITDLAYTSLTPGSREYTITTNFAAGDEVTIDGVTVQCLAEGVTNRTTFDWNYTIESCVNNLKNCLNLSSAAGTALKYYTATVNGTILTLTEKKWGSGHTPGTMSIDGTGVVSNGTAVTSASTVKATEDWAEGAWSIKNGYPACVKFYQNRIGFAGTTKDPLTLWLSQIGDYPNFLVHPTPEDDDAITAPLVSQGVNSIRSMVSLGNMLAFTAGGEWKIGTGSESVGLTPSTVRALQQGYRGSSTLEPLIVGDRILYCQEMGSVVRDFGYSIADDAYKGDDLTLYAKHFFRNHNIVDWCFQQEPDGIIWAVRDDGSLLSFTYIKEQDVWAWAKHTTDGEFESVAAIPGDGYTEVYFVVKREISGETKRYIEKLMPRMISTDPRDQFFVDCGLSYDNPISITGITQASPIVVTAASHGLIDGNIVDISDVVGMTELNNKRYKVGTVTTNTFTLINVDDDSNIDGTGFAAYKSSGYVRKCTKTVTNLDHLEGKTVAILADGSVSPSQVVTSGSITLDDYASRIHVGLGYTCDVETLNIDIPLKDGTVQNRKKFINKVTVMFENSYGGYIGVNGDDNLEEIGPILSDTMGNPGDLVTGNKSVNPYSTWDNNATVLIRQSDPLPMTVLSIMPEVVIGADTD